jgi:hypothetical protein
MKISGKNTWGNRKQITFCGMLVTIQSNRQEVAGSWRKLHNEEFHNLYSSPNIIRVMIWVP